MFLKNIVDFGNLGLKLCYFKLLRIIQHSSFNDIAIATDPVCEIIFQSFVPLAAAISSVCVVKLLVAL